MTRKLFLPASTLTRHRRTRRQFLRDLATFAVVLAVVLGAVAVGWWMAE